jgi:hypothetical protein
LTRFYQKLRKSDPKSDTPSKALASLEPGRN